MRKTLILAASLICVATASWAHPSGCDITVITDGAARPEYSARGTTYVEALRGRDYTLRISNPTPHRVAVALAVDGLNTIDARHTDSWNARKWVLDPYESIDIDGWQVNDSTARRFVFTGERNSYGAALGQTENLGVIEAIFYREQPVRYFSEERESAPSAGAARAQPKSSADDYAATGMGDRKRHDVTMVDIDLDPNPIASVRIRYEFRPQLIKLGVLRPERTPLERREKAQGFCPEMN